MEDTCPLTKAENRKWNMEVLAYQEGRNTGILCGFFLGSTIATLLFFAIEYLIHSTKNI